MEKGEQAPFLVKLVWVPGSGLVWVGEVVEPKRGLWPLRSPWESTNILHLQKSVQAGVWVPL